MTANVRTAEWVGAPRTRVTASNGMTIAAGRSLHEPDHLDSGH
jgi:hypothetical protein